MNRRRVLASILLAGGIALIATGVFPPWLISYERQGRPKVYTAVEYNWLSASPHLSNYTPIQGMVQGFGFSIDYGRLTVEWAMVVVATGLAAALAMMFFPYFNSPKTALASGAWPSRAADAVSAAAQAPSEWPMKTRQEVSEKEGGMKPLPAAFCAVFTGCALYSVIGTIKDISSGQSYANGLLNVLFFAVPVVALALWQKQKSRRQQPTAAPPR